MVTLEFYKQFVVKMVPMLLYTYEESMDSGSLPSTVSQALITLILKKEKDPTNCKSYRPIYLINCDRKVLPKILANRLDKVVSTLVHPD